MIKHLTPRSDEEILNDSDIRNVPREKLMEIWLSGKLIYCSSLDKKIFYEIERRQIPEFDSIKKSDWYKLHKWKL